MSQSLIDIGVNLSNNRFADDLDQVIERALATNIKQLVLTGTSVQETQKVIEICDSLEQKYPNTLYATAGIHPHDADELNSEKLTILSTLADSDAVVAIGETGLDFNRNFSTTANQISAFEAQLELAAEKKMPLFMHERDAAEKQIEIITDYRDHFTRGVIHCFTGDKQTLYRYLDLDLYIGITGWVCDPKRGEQLRKIVADIPLNRLMIETDAPYLIPKNMPQPPKNRRNEPAFLGYVLEEIQNQRSETVETIAQATTANAKQFFNI
jgi:TatD DNase family protein